MGLFNIQFGRLKIPVYDIGTLASGFYIGYNEGKGIDTSPTLEYIAKYGPTALALTATPFLIGLKRSMEKMVVSKTRYGLQDGSLKVKKPDGSVKSYTELSDSEKKKITPEITDSIDRVEQNRDRGNYLTQTVRAGTVTAVETLIGYVAGNIYSRLE